MDGAIGVGPSLELMALGSILVYTMRPGKTLDEGLSLVLGQQRGAMNSPSAQAQLEVPTKVSVGIQNAMLTSL